MGTLKANLAIALGYWMLYCGLAQGGAFALSPWQALQPGSGGGSSSASTSPQPAASGGVNV